MEGERWRGRETGRDAGSQRKVGGARLRCSQEWGGVALCGQSGSFQIPQLESPDQTEPACSFGDYTEAVEGD